MAEHENIHGQSCSEYGIDSIKREDNNMSADNTDTASVRPCPVSAEFDVDALLDDIDSLLESDASAFVQSFVQKGGQ